jgi:hypothetical protein
MRRRHDVDRAIAERQFLRVAHHAQHARIAPQVEEVIDLEIEPHPQRHLRHRLQQIRRPRAEVENRPWREPPHQPPIDRNAAAVTIEPPQIAQRALHVFAGSVVFVEQFFRGLTRRSEHHFG